MKKKIYLAIPYTGIEELSYRLANIIAYKIMSLDHNVVSPISMGHSIVEEGKNNPNLDKSVILGTFEYWDELSYSLIDWADEVWYVKINEELLEHSDGTQCEIRYALTNKKTIKQIDIQLIIEDNEIVINDNLTTIELLKCDINDLHIILPA